MLDVIAWAGGGIVVLIVILVATIPEDAPVPPRQNEDSVPLMEGIPMTLLPQREVFRENPDSNPDESDV